MTYFMVGIYWEICWDCISNEIVVIDGIVKMTTLFIDLWRLGFVFQTRKVTSIMIRVICESKNNPYHDNVGAKDTWSRPSAVTSKDGCVFRWSLSPNSAWGSIETTTIGKTHPLYIIKTSLHRKGFYTQSFSHFNFSVTKIQIFKRKFKKIS